MERPLDHDLAISIVSKHMNVFNYFIQEDNSLEFTIAHSHTMKEDFQRLLDSLKSYEMIAMLRKSGDSLTLIVGNIPRHRERARRQAARQAEI